MGENGVTSQLTVDGGTLTVDGSLLISSDYSQFTLNAGAVTVEGFELGVFGSEDNFTINAGTLTTASLLAYYHNTFTVFTGGTLSVAGDVNNTNVDDYYHIVGGTFAVQGTFTSSDSAIQAEGGGQVQLAGLAIASDLETTNGVTLIADESSSIEIGTAGGAAAGSITVDSGVTTTVSGSFNALNIINNGTIDVLAGGTLTLDGTITNDGTLEASCGGTLDIKSTVANVFGTLLAASGGLLDIETAICGGSATIDHGTLEFGGKSNVDVTFDNSHGYGELILGDPKDFSGQISDFTGSAIGISNSDEIFLLGVQENDEHPLDAEYNSDSNITTVTIYEDHGGQIKLYFVGDYEAGNFKLQQDDSGLEIYDPPTGGSKHAPSTVTTASDDHTNAPANQVAHVTDHATSPSNLFGFGGGQDSAAATTAQDGAAAPPANQLAAVGDAVTAPPSATAALGGNDLVAFGDDHVAAPTAGLASGAGALQISIITSPIAIVVPVPGAPVLDVEHLTDSTITDGSGAAHDEVAPPAVPTAPTNNEHTVAPALLPPPPSPALASASFGGMGNDNFAFHPNLGSDTAQNTDAHTSEIAHNNVQISGPALASIVPEFHQEFAFDAIHQDAANLAATVDQFHQMASNSTLLH